MRMERESGRRREMAGLLVLQRAGRIRRSRLCQKEKEQSRLSKAPDREVGETRGE